MNARTSITSVFLMVGLVSAHPGQASERASKQAIRAVARQYKKELKALGGRIVLQTTEIDRSLGPRWQTLWIDERGPVLHDAEYLRGIGVEKSTHRWLWSFNSYARLPSPDEVAARVAEWRKSPGKQPSAIDLANKRRGEELGGCPARC
jgi:hypothetical protein